MDLSKKTKELRDGIMNTMKDVITDDSIKNSEKVWMIEQLTSAWSCLDFCRESEKINP